MTKIAFCFPGQGSVEPGMGRDIAEAVSSARAVFARSREAVAETVDLALPRTGNCLIAGDQPRPNARRNVTVALLAAARI